MPCIFHLSALNNSVYENKLIWFYYMGRKKNNKAKYKCVRNLRKYKEYQNKYE